MAKGVKTGGRDFEPGQSGNPAGRPPLDPDVKAVRNLTTVQLVRHLNVYLGLTFDEIKAKAKEKNATALERMLAKIVENGVEHGGLGTTEFLLERMIGKVPEKLDATIHTDPFAGKTTKEKIELLEEALTVLRAQLKAEKATQSKPRKAKTDV